MHSICAVCTVVVAVAANAVCAVCTVVVAVAANAVCAVCTVVVGGGCECRVYRGGGR